MVGVPAWPEKRMLEMSARKLKAASTLSEEELARYTCNDCGVNVVTIGEFYMLRPEIWEGQLGLGREDNLCIGCLEARLGRKVGPGLVDFCHFPVYPWLRPISDRLLNRYGFEMASG